MDPHFEGVIFQTHAYELAKRLQRGFPAFQAIDVREATAFASSHIPGATSASAEELTLGLPEGTDEATEFIIIGSDPDDRSVRMASQALRANGARRVVEFGGGMSEWNAYGYEQEEA